MALRVPAEMTGGRLPTRTSTVAAVLSSRPSSTMNANESVASPKVALLL